MECQPWYSEEYALPFDDVSYFPDSKYNSDVTLSDVRNYCRNPSIDGDYAIRPWCNPWAEFWDIEYCDIPVCQGQLTNFIVNLSC